jgi:hypothetical protein
VNFAETQLFFCQVQPSRRQGRTGRADRDDRGAAQAAGQLNRPSDWGQADNRSTA